MLLRLLGVLIQAMFNRGPIDCKRDGTESLSELTAAISVANENSRSLGNARDVITQSTMSNFMYALQDVPGKGKGLVAMRKISKGTRILSEEVVITIEEQGSSKRLQTAISQQVIFVGSPKYPYIIP